MPPLPSVFLVDNIVVLKDLMTFGADNRADSRLLMPLLETPDDDKQTKGFEP